MGENELSGPSGSPFLSLKDIVMEKKILSLREHYDLKDRQGTRIGGADANFIQFPAKFSVFDQTHSEVMHLQGKILSFRKEFTMYDPSGNQLGVIRKKLLKLVGSEYWLERNGVEFMRIYGNFTEHDYQMAVNQVQVAQVHKKWVSLRDQFNISITGEIDPRIVIGSAIVIEHEEVKEKQHRNR
jgi:uncharacterized protein YxjI